MTMTYAFFLGCIMPNRYPGIEVATRKVAEALDIKLIDMPGASCCPAPGVIRSFDIMTWLTVAARNLLIAEQLKAPIAVVCNGCYASLKEASELLRERPEYLSQVNEILVTVTGKKYRGTAEVVHLCHEVYEKVGVEKIKGFVKKPFNAPVAVHYGCHILRPARKGRVDDPEEPKFLDQLVEALGAKSVSYKDKLMCCGAGGGVRSGLIDVALDYTQEKILNAKRAGAECIVNICPFCHLQFDRGQGEIESKRGVKPELPVLHWMQTAALSFGLATPREIGLHAQVVNCDPLLKKLGFS
jgi:heterodisulfide reductase subunit B